MGTQAARPFTNTDWYGLAGATSFSANTPPVIGYRAFDPTGAVAAATGNGEAEIVGDLNGICVMPSVPVPATADDRAPVVSASYTLAVTGLTQATAAALIDGLPATLTHAWLMAAGFEFDGLT